MIKAVTTARVAPVAGPFSPAVQSGGTVYISGQVAQDPATGKLLEGDVARQADQAFRNLGAVLDACGKSFTDVVRVGVFVTDGASFSAMNDVYRRYFQPPYPARTSVVVAALPLGAAIEVDAIAT